MVIARRNVPNIACCTSTVLTKPPLEKSGLKVALLRFIELSRPETSLLYHATRGPTILAPCNLLGHALRPCHENLAEDGSGEGR
jgi:hypothetical protein